MVGFFNSLQNAIRTGFCQFVADEARLEYAFAQATGSIYSPEGIPGTSAFWRTLVCDTPVPPTKTPPFQGGQCFTSYNVSGVYNVVEKSTGNTFQATFNILVTGQVNGLSVSNPGPITSLDLQFTQPNGQSGTANITSLGNQFDINGQAITNIVRSDGLPDNCGNPPVPPPPPPPPGSNVQPTNVTYINNDGVDVIVPVVLVYGQAFVDINANVTIPIEVNINANANFTANFNISTGGISINPGSGGGRDRSPNGGGKGNGNKGRRLPVNPPPNPITPENPEDDADDNESIIGVIVTTTTVDSSKPTIIGQLDNPDIYAPSLGYVSFEINIGDDGVRAWTTDIPVKNLRQIIECPWDGGAVDVKGTPIPGVEFTLTPIRKEPRKPTPIT